MRVRGGQAMVEYVLAFAAIVTVTVVLTYAVQAGFRSSERSSTMLKSDCP